MQLKFTRISPLIVSDDFETADIVTPITLNQNNLSHIKSQPLLMRPMTINNQNPTIKIKPVRSKLIYRHMSINEPMNQEVNIFNDETMKTLKPNEKGPQYDEQGAIKKSSVVGPISLFGTDSRKLMKLDDEEFLKSPSESTRSKKFDESKKKKKNMMMKTTNECILNSKEVENEIIRITQHVQDIQEVENRTKKNAFKGIPIGDRNYLTKFERVNNRFQSTVEQWLSDEKTNGKLIGRVPQASVYRRCEETRTRNEFVLVLDNLVPDYERMGDNFWQNNLRSSQRPQTSMGPGRVPVEIIRKPNSSKLKSNFEGKLPFSSFSSGQYFDSKMSEHRREVELIVEGDKAQIADIEILGRNVLRTEVQSLRCKLGTQNTYVKQLFLQNQGNVPEEVIGSQWSRNRWGSEKFDCAITSKMRN